EKADKQGETKADKPLPLSNTPRPTDRKIRVIGSAARTDENTTAQNDEPEKDSKEKTSAAKPDEKVAETSVPEGDPKSKEAADDSPLTVGSLIGYATKRVTPVYPRQARTMRMTGVVKVELVIDEDGNVAKVENTEGPSMLQRAATDAIKKWQFRPFMRDGQPVKAIGFVSFNFDL
ncbi:MAG: TonB family protein, partial [Acidobacteria bacterium]|nr:TonB family protein [Acidobacteriota bacterium]